MAIIFPSSPINGQTYNSGYALYTYSAAAGAWLIQANAFSSNAIISTAPSVSTMTGALIVSGGVGIGGTMWVGGPTYAQAFNSTSDARQKTNIETIINSLDIVAALRGVTFNWVNGGNAGGGLIAQDVEPLLPQLVNTGDNGIKSLNYDGIVGLLVEAVKSLTDRVAQLESKE